MLVVSAGALWGAGRADGMRVTEGRFLTSRRKAGRATGLGGLAATAFFLAMALRTAGFFALAALRLTGFLPLPDPVFDLPLAMLASRCPTAARHFHMKNRVYSSLISTSRAGAAAPRTDGWRIATCRPIRPAPSDSRAGSWDRVRRECRPPPGQRRCRR